MHNRSNAADAAMPLIAFDHVSFSYGSHLVLDDVSFAIAPGECCALVGPNGCGKTTIMRIINGLEFAQAGEYRFDGARIDGRALADELAAKRFHQRVGYVFQDADSQLFCSSVREEVAFGPRQMSLSERDVRRRVEDALGLFDVADLADEAPYRLSGGQKKRVALASIVSMNPQVLVLDEPTNGLDEDSADMVCDFLRAYTAAGKTVLVTTHHRVFVQALGARPIRLDRYHRIVSDASVGEVAI